LIEIYSKIFHKATILIKIDYEFLIKWELFKGWKGVENISVRIAGIL